VAIVDTDNQAATITLLAGVNGRHHVIANVGSSGNDVTIETTGNQLLLGTDTDHLLHDGETLALYFQDTEGWVAA